MWFFYLRVGLDCAFGVCVFFLYASVSLWLLFMYCLMNSSRKFWLFYFFSQSMHIMHYLWTHKFYFSVIFSLKMCSMILFTHLKIILLQHFLIFNFQFSIFNCIQTELNINIVITVSTHSKRILSKRMMMCA